MNVREDFFAMKLFILAKFTTRKTTASENPYSSFGKHAHTVALINFWKEIDSSYSV